MPRLATFFHLSLEELLAYRPQLTREEIRTVYRRLSAAFSSQPLEQVLEQCRQLAKEYYSCFPLLFQLGSLYVNHTHLASGPEQVKEMLQQAMKLFVRVKNQSREIGLIKQARNMEAYCLLNLGHTNSSQQSFLSVPALAWPSWRYPSAFACRSLDYGYIIAHVRVQIH